MGLRRIALSLLLIIVAFLFTTSVHAQVLSGAGSFSFSLKLDFTFNTSGYPIQGELSDAVINSDRSVMMTMSIDQVLHTPIGALPITGSGQWYGEDIGGTLWGTIQNITGTVHLCGWFPYPILSCPYAEYIGNGDWTGQLSGSQGSGTFEAVIRFWTIPFTPATPFPPSPPVGESILVSGTWTATFQPSN